jgi:hypothetical protein
MALDIPEPIQGWAILVRERRRSSEPKSGGLSLPESAQTDRKRAQIGQSAQKALAGSQVPRFGAGPCSGALAAMIAYDGVARIEPAEP